MSTRMAWTGAQRAVVIACFLGWMLDAFDYFLVVFVLQRLASDFSTNVTRITLALTLTLMMRPIGALLFGRAADRYGRRPALMASILLYSLFEFATAFSPSLTVFFVLRALYGVSMGGEWGVGASLAFESVPVSSRGWISGILQAGYPAGYLLAAVVFGLAFPYIGWRGMFIVGALPALLVLYIWRRVPESQPASARAGLDWRGFAAHWPLALYAIALMTAFNFFSHGTQDLYPTLLQHQRGFSTHATSIVAIIYNIGAICGGLFFGRLSGVIGRRRAIALAAVLALPVLPFWVMAQHIVAVAAAAFLIQFMVQGAWGVVPVHLNELSPDGMRATFPGVVYQLGNLIASSNAPLQSLLAVHVGGAAHPNYAFALGLVCALTALALLVLALLGPERRGVRLGFAAGES
ncbi:MAG TPA: MFS transporter [Steroidobacteraceae bacterium]|nr:MFS transporter [Steroidobacteraceae bacterium]